MARLARMHEIGGRAGRREGRGDLAADMAGFAHAGDDQPAREPRDQFDRGDERLRQPVADRRDQRGDAAGLGLERAQRRLDQRAVLDWRVRASRLAFVNYLAVAATS